MKKTRISSEQNIFQSLRDVPNFTGLIRYLILRDFIIRYRNTWLGLGWSLARPLLQIILFGSVYFLINKGRSLNTTLTNSFFIVSAGIIIWQMISSIITEGSNSLLQNSSIVSKVYFPRIILPLTSSILPLVDFFVSFLVFILIAQLSNFSLQFHLLPFIISLAVLFLISLSFSVILAMMNIFFRDIKLLLPYVLQLIFFSLPIFIDIQVLEEELFKKYPKTESLYFLNPLSYPVLIFKQSLFDVSLDINIYRLLYSVCFGLIMLVLSAFYFQKKEQDIVEYF